MSTYRADTRTTAGCAARLRLRPASLLRRGGVALAVVCALSAEAGVAETASPFVPPPPAKPKIVRLLAYPDYFDPRSLEGFERASGYAVAYDSYDSPDGIADKWREGPYDLVVLPGPALARRIAPGALARLDRSRLPGARA